MQLTIHVTNLITDVKSLLLKLGFEQVWLNQGVESKDLIFVKN